jgi:hypothetical protein
VGVGVGVVGDGDGDGDGSTFGCVGGVRGVPSARRGIVAVAVAVVNDNVNVNVNDVGDRGLWG